MEGDLLDYERIGNKKRGRDEKGTGVNDGVERRLEKKASGMQVLIEDNYSGDEMINGVKYEEEKETLSPVPVPVPVPDPVHAPAPPVGLFNQLITNLVSSPRSNHSPRLFESETINGDGGEVAAEKGGGVAEEDGGDKDAVDNIVARLPRTLSEDTVAAAPATDEASILIHSIIHD